MYPPDQWQSESLNLDIACARFGLAPGDRFGKAPCAPVPDLLQSTQGSDMIARFSRPSSLSGQSLTDSLTSPPTTVTQSHTGIFGHSQTATNLAMAAADTAFTLRASSLEQSESTSVACYEARAYSPVLYPSLQQTIREINCTDLSPNPSADHDFVLFDKREQFVHPTKTPEEFSSESKSTVNEKTSEWQLAVSKSCQVFLIEPRGETVVCLALQTEIIPLSESHLNSSFLGHVIKTFFFPLKFSKVICLLIV